MNRIQFFVITGLASLLLLLLIGNVALTYSVSSAQSNAVREQQTIQEAGTFRGYLQELAGRIWQDSQRTADPGLKDLLARQQITYTPPTTNSTETPASPSAT